MQKKDKMTNNDPQITTKKTKDCATPGVKSGTPEG
jgi:hypothetical protein